MAATFTAAEPVELLRGFRAELQSKRDALSDVAGVDPRAASSSSGWMW